MVNWFIGSHCLTGLNGYNWLRVQELEISSAKGSRNQQIQGLNLFNFLPFLPIETKLTSTAEPELGTAQPQFVSLTLSKITNFHRKYWVRKRER